MYWNVPITVPCSVRGCDGTASVGSEVPAAGEAPGLTATFARPKSRSFTPDLVSMTLPGFKSR